MKAFWKKKTNKPQEPQSILMMESDTLGMTVIQQDNATDHIIQPLSTQEWVQILMEGKLDGYPYSRVYFSFLKGLPEFMRMKIWLFLVKKISTEPAKEKGKRQQKNKIKQQQGNRGNRKSREGLELVTTSQYLQLSSRQPQQKEVDQIFKDIHRSYSGKQNYLYTKPLLKKILHSLSNWGVSYTQGMNYILLNVIIYCLDSIGIRQENFHQLHIEIQRDLFIILVGIISLLEQTFGNNNIFKSMKQLEQKIAESVPEILFLIYKLGMDCFCCFSQNYFSLMSYGDPPPEMCVYMMDLFFLQGEEAIHSMIVRMLEISSAQILQIKDTQKLQRFMKKDIFHVCYETLKNQKLKANKISDFGLSFYQNMQHF